MRRRGSVLAATIVAVALAGCSGGGVMSGGTAHGACEAPTLTVSPETAAPGETVAVTGAGWTVCNDTPNDPSGEAPWREVTVELRQDGASRVLGTAPIEDGRLDTEVTVPADARPGFALLVVGRTDATYTVGLTIED